MEAWKARAASAQAAISAKIDAKKGPTSYSPNRYDPSAPPPLSAEERARTSRVLPQPQAKAQARPDAPPRRYTVVPPVEAPAPAGPPRLPSRTSSAVTVAASTPPRAPPRTAKPAFLSRASSSSLASARAPAPPAETNPSVPTLSVSRRAPPGDAAFKPFSLYDAGDKQSFFAMLDEFFTGAGPPPAPTTTRPTPPPTYDALLPSYPPPQPYASSALTLLHYILYAPFTSAWYATPSTPDPLVGRNDIRMASSWSQTGNQKTSLGIVIFGDCSVCWWKISWSLTGGSLKREGRYRPIPSPEGLYEASERYGPLLAQFALEAVEKRQPVGRGECWDIANSGLEYAATQLPPGEKPFPSIGRTHGVLIYYGIAGKDAVGLWKGGEEEYVRPGDIVEWRTVTIREVGMQPGAYAILGAPDHTAIITSAGSPSSTPYVVDGSAGDVAYPIAALVSLAVVEQSQGHHPKHANYDLTTMTAGEVWIYRPVSLVALLKTEIDPSWPRPGVGYEL